MSDHRVSSLQIDRYAAALMSSVNPAIIANHSGQAYEKVFLDADRNYWMAAEEALVYGMIDYVKGKK